ncbi:FHA domain-containing protein [Haliangium sp.]|uniref:FHA domain-containing protein n=1 Tax=Haliangium sp. TaxID=2663208 RepID=UPI003D0BB48D
MPASSTRTTISIVHRTDLEAAPVVGLRVLPSGQYHDFASFRIEGYRKRILVIGSEPSCDIVLDHPSVSRLHCVVEQHGDRVIVHDCDSTNGLRLNEVPAPLGELKPGTLVGLGCVLMVAYGPGEARARIAVTAATFDEFLLGAVYVHGSLRGAAEAVGLPYSTLRGWMKRRFGPDYRHHIDWRRSCGPRDELDEQDRLDNRLDE